MRRPNRHSADIALSALLDALAPVLISLELTPARVEKLTKASFAKAGALSARMKSTGRPHLARIAAITGLTRSEVKRLVATNYKVDQSDPETFPRALRVLNAWLTSPEYLRNGRPLRLKITGGSPSFFQLCKSHSGDIPFRVILSELENRGRVTISRNENRVSVKQTRQRSTKNLRDYSTLLFATAFLREALKSETVLVKRKERIASSRDLPDAYVENAITTRIADIMDQLPRLFVRKNASRTNLLNVFTLVTKASPKRK